MESNIEHELKRRLDSYFSYFNEAVNFHDIERAIFLINKTEEELKLLEKN